MTDKKCCVCELLKSDKSFEEHINNSLKTDMSVKEVWQELTSKVDGKAPTKYFLEQHKTICLKNFIPYVKPVNIVLHNIVEDDLKIDFDTFDNFTSIQKDNEYQKILHQIYYKKLLSLNNNKKLPKEEISSLKILNDLINLNNLDVSNINIGENIKDQSDIEKTGVELISLIMRKGLLSQNTAMDIAKLFIKNSSDIEFLKDIAGDITDSKMVRALEALVVDKSKKLENER